MTGYTAATSCVMTVSTDRKESSMKEMCHWCGISYDRTDNYCRFCGIPLKSRGRMAAAAKKRPGAVRRFLDRKKPKCDFCGAAYEIGNKYCPGCGVQIEYVKSSE